jgi:hypothetical protein
MVAKVAGENKCAKNVHDHYEVWRGVSNGSYNLLEVSCAGRKGLITFRKGRATGRKSCASILRSLFVWTQWIKTQIGRTTRHATFTSISCDLRKFGAAFSCDYFTSTKKDRRPLRPLRQAVHPTHDMCGVIEIPENWQVARVASLQVGSGTEPLLSACAPSRK